MFVNFPEPNHQYGYTESFLHEAFDKFGLSWMLFDRWMIGQTTAFDGETIYYTHDVQKYLKRGGIFAEIDD
jgi:hypothetical protein